MRYRVTISQTRRGETADEVFRLRRKDGKWKVHEHRSWPVELHGSDYIQTFEAATWKALDEQADRVATLGEKVGALIQGRRYAEAHATAKAFFTPTPAGLKILLDADGLAGADPDHMYEAWISDGEIRVSAGTFHLRDGHDPIELWAGTDDPRFHLITVTIEPIDGVAESSGQVVLKGEFSMPGGTESDDDSGQYEPD